MKLTDVCDEDDIARRKIANIIDHLQWIKWSIVCLNTDNFETEMAWMAMDDDGNSHTGSSEKEGTKEGATTMAKMRQDIIAMRDQETCRKRRKQARHAES